ncbi:hypothetical protein [Streptomyces sp. NBC_00140]|uniref:hypothetical protein n=1 Tax=Streptomyces sp. NBC_00140 TaxID=2975664 RepID=UPI00224C9BA1|nr:hypothetical protein [Streptomyces sp. NBC_00140]MCX5327811.1 hypothetical protein [Streptomyces sp. NBC_00140]MCX5336822.1 hypothetical protein [Streptomyces sp. NBC_00140]
MTAFAAARVSVLIGNIVSASARTARTVEPAVLIAEKVAHADRQANDPAQASTRKTSVVDSQDAVPVAHACDTAFLSAAGIGSLAVAGHGEAALLYSVTTPEGNQ